jgi:lysophospholipase L1-like esterase
MKLVFLGDSLTWGQFGGDWVAGVARAMPEHDVVNAGVGGDTVVNLLARLESVLEAHAPSAMFVMVGGNDAVSYGMPDTRLYYKSAKQVKPDGVVSPERYEASYRELLTTLQLRHVQTFVGLAPTEYNAKLISLRQQYNAIAQETARRLNIPTLDLASAFVPERIVERADVSLAFIQEIGKRLQEGWQDYEAERQRWGYTFTFDGMHLLPATAERFAELVVAFLREQMA